MPIRRPPSVLAPALNRWEDRLFTEPRIRLFGAAVLAVNLVLLAALASSGGWVARSGGQPAALDFCFIWTAGRFAGSPDPAAAYDYAMFSAAEADLFGAMPAGLPYYHFLYPPTFLLLTYPIGLLPYFVAFAVWSVATFLMFAAVSCAALPRAATVIAASATVAAFHNIQAGQNGFLTAGLIGAALASMERRPVLSGVFIGLLTYKPQFGILFPVALLAAGKWRVVAAAIVTALALALATMALFGSEVWRAYFASFGSFDGSLSPGHQLRVLHQSFFGLLYWLNAGLPAAWTVHLIGMAATACIVATLWARPTPYRLRAAALCIGSVAATPYVVSYDLCVLSVAIAFLAADGLERGFVAGERALLLACFVGSYVAFYARWPFGPAVYCCALAIVVLRARQAQRPLIAAGVAEKR